MSEMQKGFLYNQVRYKALSTAVKMAAISAFAAMFGAAGVYVGIEEGDIWCGVAQLVIAAAGFSALFAHVCVTYFRKYLDPSRSDAFAGLSRHGKPRDMAVKIEMELAGEEKELFGPVELLPTWIVFTGSKDIHLVKYGELVSVTHRTTDRRLKGVKIGDNHHLYVVTSHERFNVNIRPKPLEKLLLRLGQRLPPNQVVFD